MAKDKAGMTPAPRKTTPKKPATTKKVAGKAAPERQLGLTPGVFFMRKRGGAERLERSRNKAMDL